MFKTFILLATIYNPNVANISDTYVIDYNLTDSDCQAILLDVADSDGFEVEPRIVFNLESSALECQPENEIPPCEFDDSDFCFWDAANRGNGQGKSFIAWNGEVFYTE